MINLFIHIFCEWYLWFIYSYDPYIYDFFIYIFQEKAFELAITMNHDDFTASNDCGESAEVPEAAVQDWAQRLPELCRDYAPKDIFNADETGLYFRALPTRSMVVKGDPRKGTKSSKERITALLAASATGEKLKLFVIGKSQNPRALRSMDKSLLTVTYKANKHAWMTSKLFSEWCDKLNSKMRASRRKILLFVDNCSAHPAVTLSNLKLVFLPPNTTSRLQPCDAGIIASVKAHYRRRLLRHLLSEMDEANTATDLSKRINIKHAISWLSMAWTSVTETCIQKCFAKCGFKTSEEAFETVDEPEPLPPQVQKLLGDTTWDEYVAMDNGTVTTAVVEDNWEEELVAKPTDGTPCESSEGSDSDEEVPSRPKVTSREAVDHLKHVLDFAMDTQNIQMIETANKLMAMLEDHRVEQAGKQKQF